MSKSVLISTFSIPYRGIASWTSMLSYYVNNRDQIDFIICPDDDMLDRKKEIQYHFTTEPRYFRYKMDRWIKYYRFYSYWKSVEKILETEHSLILMIIDNPGLLKAIDHHAKKTGKRKRLKILFFIHGYSYYMTPSESEAFYAMIDELIVLTNKSYRFQLQHTHAMSCEVTQIYNGIDSTRFHPVDQSEREALRQSLELERDTLYFLWLSQDRPKKGLHIVLRAWETLYEKYDDIELLVIGTHHEVKQKGVRWLGRIPNPQLPPYYQACDFYLFPTLWHEGFGLSLAEAMKCGCVCLASDIEPVDEVMADGAYGRLVESPHFVQSWVVAIEEEMQRYRANGRVNPYLDKIPDDLYDLQVWCDNIDALLEKWKRRSGGIS